MAIKFGFGKVKLVNENVEETKTKPTEHSVEFRKEVNPISLQVSIESKNKDNFEESKKSELKYIRMKKASGIFSGVGSAIFTYSTIYGVSKTMKEKDLAHGIATGITGLLAVGLGVSSVFNLKDAHEDKKAYKKRHGN